MSILNRTESRPEDIPVEVRIASRIKKQTVDTYKGLVGIYVEGLNSFWKNPMAKPEEIAAALGSDAAEIFSLHAKLGEFLLQFNPERIAEAKQVIGEFTVNSDGTVTVVPKSE